MNIQTLIDLMQINSYSHNVVGVNDTSRYVREQLTDVPVQWQRERASGYGDFWAGKTTQLNHESPTIGLVLHVDTIHSPDVVFQVRKEGDRLYGPGAIDMQASLYVLIELLHRLHASRRLYNLSIVLNSCEEKGSPAYLDTMKHIALQVDYAMGFEAQSIEMSSEAHDGEWALITARKGIFQQAISTHGPGGHSGMLEQRAERKNAISEMTRMMQVIDGLADYDKGTTVNLACIQGGQENTVIAQDCRLVFDVRYWEASERARVKRAIADCMQQSSIAGVEIVDEGYLYDLPSLQPNTGSETFLELVKRAVQPMGLAVSGEQRGGWGDVCNMHEYNPALKILDGFGPKGFGEHTREECVLLSSIEPAIEMAYRTIVQIQDEGV